MVGGVVVTRRYLVEQAEPRILCFRCGICCRRYRVRLSLVEGRCIADGLRLTWNEFQRKYIEKHWRGADTFFLRQNRGACSFLEHAEGSNKTSCSIHPFKPYACRDWTPSLYRCDCQEGLAKYWGLTVGCSSELRGPEERIERFQSFLASLVVDIGFNAERREIC